MTKTHEKRKSSSKPSEKGKKEPGGSNCGICGKHFQYEHKMRVHLRIHTGETPYNCSHCDKAFAQKAALTVHERTHTGEKPFVCELCHKAFARADHLNQHNRTHTGEKPYSCDVCSKSFATWSAISRHKAEHTSRESYPCSQCNKTFSRSDNLRAHVIKTHLPDYQEDTKKVRVTASPAAVKKKVQTKDKEVAKNLDIVPKPDPEEIEAIAKILEDDDEGREAETLQDASNAEITQQVKINAKPPEEYVEKEKAETSDGQIKHETFNEKSFGKEKINIKVEEELILHDDEQESSETSCTDDMLGSHFLYA